MLRFLSVLKEKISEDSYGAKGLCEKKMNGSLANFLSAGQVPTGHTNLFA